MAKSLNKVQLLGNLTRDPELRYTPNGKAVCSFGLATNRTWTTDSGEKKEEVEFHNIVAWNKLAEICSQYLSKGRKTYLEGRLATRSWTGQDGNAKTRTEIVIDDMILLDSKGSAAGSSEAVQLKKPVKKVSKKEDSNNENAGESVSGDEEVSPDDIPF